VNDWRIFSIAAILLILLGGVIGYLLHKPAPPNLPITVEGIAPLPPAPIIIREREILKVPTYIPAKKETVKVWDGRNVPVDTPGVEVYSEDFRWSTHDSLGTAVSGRFGVSFFPKHEYWRVGHVLVDPIMLPKQKIRWYHEALSAAGVGLAVYGIAKDRWGPVAIGGGLITLRIAL